MSRAGGKKYSGAPWLLKVGGSLAEPSALLPLLEMVEELSENHAIVITPGGGRFADFIRDHSRETGASQRTAHAQAVLAVAQYGYEIVGRLGKGAAVRRRAEVASALDEGRIPVFIPYPFAVDNEDIPATWDATSDTIAVETLRYLGFTKLVFIKSVDGVFINDKLVKSVSRETIKETDLLDPLAPKRLGADWEVFIINGRAPERLRGLLTNGATIATRIITRGSLNV